MKALPSFFFLATVLWVQVSLAATGAKISALDGTAQVARVKTPNSWAPIKKGDEIAQGDTVKTGAKSRVELALTDGSVLRLGPDSKLALQSFVPTEDPNQRKSSFKLWVGRAWAKVAKAAGAGQFEVETRSAVAGVRGTTFRVNAETDSSTVVRVYAGAVAVNNMPVYARPGEKKRPTIRIWP